MKENNLLVTPINYEQAASILDISVDTLQQAIGRGVLSKLPRKGLRMKLIKEQVSLFAGKRLSISELNKTENDLWLQYKEISSTYGNDAFQLSSTDMNNSYVIQLSKKMDIIQQQNIALMELQKQTVAMLAMVHL